MFDPFGDFEEAGYLRNFLGLKDQNKIKSAEHLSFSKGLEEACSTIADARGSLDYDDLMNVHKILFELIYPWAGVDRYVLCPTVAVSKGGVVDFAHPYDIRRSVDYALEMGNDRKKMKDAPGKVIGLLAFAHPFLDGNGRSLMVFHAELCRKAGFSIAWHKIQKEDYLKALTTEINFPDSGALDDFLKDYIMPPINPMVMAGHLLEIKGLSRPLEDEANESYKP